MIARRAPDPPARGAVCLVTGLVARFVAGSVAAAGLLCGPSTPAAAQGGSPARTAAGSQSAAVDSLAALGRLQEAAWMARAAGDSARGDALLDRLEAILRRAPRTARPLGLDSQGVSYTFRLDHGDGVRSIFKVDGSDIFCPSCGADREVAAYLIDRLLGFDLTPMTVPQTIVHDGDTLSGSAMYFVNGAARPSDVGARKPDALRFLDAVIGNSDRHRDNWLVLQSGRVVAIDHNRAFDYHPRTRPKTCWETEVDSIAAPGALDGPYRRYRDLPPDSLAASIRDVVDDPLVRAFVEMRERVAARIAERVRRPGARLPLEDCAFRF